MLRVRRFSPLPAILLTTVVILLCSAFTCSNRAALQTSAGVAASLGALQDSEIALYNAGKIEADEHRLLQEGFKVIAQADKEVRQCIYTQGSGACVDAGVSAVQGLMASPAVVGIKNPDSKQQLKIAGQTLITSLNTLKAAL